MESSFVFNFLNFDEFLFSLKFVLYFLQEILPYIEIKDTLFCFLLTILQVFHIYVFNPYGIYVLEFRDVILFPYG